jgi:outer membrane protein TolC
MTAAFEDIIVEAYHTPYIAPYVQTIPRKRMTIRAGHGRGADDLQPHVRIEHPIALMTLSCARRGRVRQAAGRIACATVLVGLAGSMFSRPAAAQQALPPVPPVETGQILTPEVHDPLLTPPAPAPRSIGSWDEALALIRAQSPDYITGRESIARAEAQKRIALAAVLPILNLQGSYTHQFYTTTFSITPQIPPITAPTPDLFSATGTVSWNILDPLEIYKVGTASENVRVTKLSFAAERRTIALAVVSAMLATLAATRVAEVNRVGLRSSLERLELTQTRYKYAQGTALDVDRAMRDADTARRLIIAGDESLYEAREALGAALGSPVPIAPPGDLNLDGFEASVARTCRLNDDIDRRPDVLAAQGQVDIAERKVREAELLFSPTIGVGSQFQQNNQAVFGPPRTWDVQGVLNVPLFDGGARYGVLRDARAAAEQARQALITTRINAIVGSVTAQRLVSVREAARDVSKRQVDLDQRIDDRTRNGYANGFGNSLDLVTSAQDLRQGEIDLALLEYQVAEARADAVLTNAECLY